MTRRAAPDLGRAIGQWEGVLRLRGFSERTISSYVYNVELLERHLGREVDPASITLDDVEALAAKWRGVSPATKRNRLIALGEFFKWGVARHEWPENPMRLVVLPKRSTPVLRRLTAVEVEAIIAASAQMPERSALVVKLFAYLGVRRSEVVLARWRDVDLVESLIVIHGKGRKDRVVPLPQPLVDQLAASKTLRGDGASDDCYLLPLRRRGGFVDPDSMIEWDKPSSGATIDAIVKEAAALAGVRRPVEVASHQFRRYLLERLLDNGVSLYVAAALAGHESIQTTANYGGGASLRAVGEALRVHGLRDTTGPRGRKPAGGRERERSTGLGDASPEVDANVRERPDEGGL